MLLSLPAFLSLLFVPFFPSISTPKQVKPIDRFLTLSALCPLWPFNNTSRLPPKAQLSSEHPFPRCSLFIMAWHWRTLYLIAWQMPLSWAYIFTITLAICTAGYLLERGRLSTTLKGNKRWRPTWSSGRDSPQHQAITKMLVAFLPFNRHRHVFLVSVHISLFFSLTLSPSPRVSKSLHVPNSNLYLRPWGFAVSFSFSPFFRLFLSPLTLSLPPFFTLVWAQSGWVNRDCRMQIHIGLREGMLVMWLCQHGLLTQRWAWASGFYTGDVYLSANYRRTCPSSKSFCCSCYFCHSYFIFKVWHFNRLTD